jgi:hypothetical protein
MLNDNIADGRDISWIWDVDFERIGEQTNSLIVTGKRALDLGLRLKYAGIDEQAMHIVPSTPVRAASKAAARQQERETALAASNGRVAGARKTRVGAKTIHPYGLAYALDSALQQTPVGETLFVIPTYTGLLEVHRELERRGLTPHYWEEKGP